MVHQIEAILGRRGGQVRWALHGARECAVHRVKLRLPHLRELVHEPWVGRLVGLVVEEHDDAAAVEDEVLQRGPVVDAHGEDGGHIRVLEEARLLDIRHVDGRVRVVAILQQNGDHVVGMGVHPRVHLAQPFVDGAGIQQVAGCVAEVRHGAVGRELHLGLQEAHAVVQLRLDVQLLVGARVAGPHKGRVVAANLRDVAELARAQLDVVVAGLRVSRLRHSGGRGRGVGAGGERAGREAGADASGRAGGRARGLRVGAGEGDFVAVGVVDAGRDWVAADSLRLGSLVEGEAGGV